MFSILIIILGLVVFEIVSSADNAIVNAHVLKTMSPKWRKIFLFWGIIFAVFIIRGLVPLLVVWLSAPEIGFMGVFHAAFSGSVQFKQLIEERKGIILLGAGVFMALLYLHWLFLEKKDPYFVPDKLIKPQHGIWFFDAAALILVALLYLARHSWLLMLSAAIGNAVFFILFGFREQAAKQEEILQGANNNLSDFSKLMYLEVLDASFSFDGVFGAFAFTTSIPLILIGNGIGALVVRQLTIMGIEKISNYRWLKNGAMTSIGILGLFMIAKSFGVHIPEYLPTLTTIGFVGLTFWKSHQLLKKNAYVN
ncbi:MAG: hypothetical protein COS30_01105 [Candidatus Portnoybacteria bacterium CG02_land_8_20_14_3_00_45_8]|uniref:DUF475 domain-containing protein n=1 Tax=Candidatus Portnoybacteria bacterium CG02_land_8_20_14_3_00_45_8 TaxID=1974807 RepID=A0A2M7D6J5_9BACT|nr:MAG: hypothetical protein COS30_01105 [Candidatus Portnoybacteria bacterium CG02_land_8_20_14_3_00_45_8]